MNYQMLLSFLTYVLLSNGLLAQSWLPQAQGVLPNNYGVFAISAVDENVVWAVSWDVTIGGGGNIPTDHSPIVIKTTNGGASWSVHEVKEAGGTISFDITAFDAQTAWITTQDYNNGTGRKLYKTSDGGATWIAKHTDVSAGIWIRFFDENEGVCLNSGEKARTTDGGETWLNGAVPFFASDEANLITSGTNTCEVVGDTIWFGTNKGRVFRSIDRGQSWEAFDTGLGNQATVYSIAFKDSQNGLLIASTNFLYRVARTTDGGASWESLPFLPFSHIHNLDYVPGTEGSFVAASAFTNPVSAYTDDFGLTWTTITTDTYYSAVQFVSPRSGWIAKDQVTDDNTPALYKWQGDIFVGLPTIETIDFQVTPNPTRNQVQLRLPADLPSIENIQLVDMQGRIVRNWTSLPSAHSLDLSEITPGLYMLQIVGAHHIGTEKVLIYH